MFVKQKLRRENLFKPIVLLVGFLMTVAPYLEAQATDTKKKILFINPGYADKGFWKTVSDTMRAASESLGFNLSIVYGDRKWPLMVSRGMAAIENAKVDYIILVNEHQQAPKLLEAANRKGIKTILLLNGLTKEQKQALGGPREKLPNYLGELVPDNEVAGFEMARSLYFAWKATHPDAERASFLTLAGDFKTPASIDRLQGLERAMKAFKVLKEYRRFTVHWSGVEAYNRTSALLLSSEINGIWAANDAIAIGAIRALREADLTPGKDVFVAGLNWSPEAIELVRSGEMTLTHGGHFLAGAWAVVLLYDLEKNYDFAKVSTELSFPMSAIDQRNADDYKRAFGDSDWRKIDFHSFSRADHPELKKYPFNLTTLLQSRRHN